MSPAWETAELLRLHSENELLRGQVKLLEDQVADRDAQLAAVRRDRKRADELPKQRDSQLLYDRAAANRWNWVRETERKLLDELETARGQRGMSAPLLNLCKTWVS